MMIPIFDKPYEDEHVLSWFLRLSKMNNISLNDFIENFLPRFKWEHSIDTVGNLSSLNCVSPLKILKYNTIYFSIFPFMPEGTQAKIVWRFFYGGDIHWYHTASNLRFCPECMKEDVENGIEPYYRVWHQLDEVHTCAKHKTKLWLIQKSNLGPLNDESVLAGASQIAEPENGVSSYIYSLYKKPIFTSLEKWGNGVFYKGIGRANRAEAIKKGNEIGIHSVSDYQYIDLFNCKSCGSTYIAHPFSHRAIGLCPACVEMLSRQELIDIKAGKSGLYILDGNHVKHNCGRTLSGGYHDFIWSNKECPCTYLPSLEDYKKEFEDDEFTIESFKTIKGKTFFYVKHSKCGGIFKVGRTDFMNRRYCRCCERRFEDKFENKFYAMVGDEYRILKLPKSTDDYFIARHNICNSVFKMRARYFLEGQRCSFCKKDYGFAKTLELLKEHADLTGYKIEDKSPDMLITLPDGKQKRLRFATVIQELTRLDEPEIFVRKQILKPMFNEKARVYLYMKEFCDENSVFIYRQDYLNLQMTPNNFFSSLRYLKKSGHILELNKGIYKIVGKEGLV